MITLFIQGVGIDAFFILRLPFRYARQAYLYRPVPSSFMKGTIFSRISATPPPTRVLLT